MSTTHSVGKRVIILKDTKGKLWFLLQEQTYSSNCFPHRPEWCYVYFGDLSGAIQEMLAYPGAVLLDVKVRRDEDCYPMVPPGAANEDMKGLAKPKRIFDRPSVICGNCNTPNPESHNFCPECGHKM